MGAGAVRQSTSSNPLIGVAGLPAQHAGTSSGASPGIGVVNLNHGAALSQGAAAPLNVANAATTASLRKLVKESWLLRELKLRESTFTHERALSVWIGTWNVNGRGLDEPLRVWFADPERNGQASCDGHDNMSSRGDCGDGGTQAPSCKEGPDLVVVGLQELDLSAEAFLLNNNTAKELGACSAIENGLREAFPSQKYKLVCEPWSVPCFLILSSGCQSHSRWYIHCAVRKAGDRRQHLGCRQRLSWLWSHGDDGK